MVVMMKMKFAVFLLPLIFFINFFQQINCIENEIICVNWNGSLLGQEMIEVTEPELYRFQKKDGKDSIYIGNDPFIIWLKTGYFDLIAKTHGHPRGNNPTAFLQPIGRPDCQQMIEATANGKKHETNLDTFNSASCFFLCSQWQKKYNPFKMWSEGGPVEISDFTRSGYPEKIYLPENQMNEYIAASPCKQTDWFNRTFPTSDYSHLKSEPNEAFKNESGISSVRLNSDGDTVVWVEIKDSAPEHYIIIQLENGSQPLDENVVIGVEANGRKPVSFDPEKNFTEIPNGIKIYLKKVICKFNYNFLGHIRYIFYVNSSITNFTATFYDAKEVNLKLKYLEEEKDGIPKPYDKPYKLEFFTITAPAARTTTKTTSTSTSTQSSTTKMNPNGNGEPSAAPMVQPENEIPSKAADINGFCYPVLIAIFMVQKLLVFFF